MKKVLMLLIFLTGILSAEPDKKFLKFVLDSVHGRNFVGCDNAISEVFAHIGGQEIRVDTPVNPDAKDSIRITSSYGSKGDNIFLDVLVRKANKVCTVSQTAMYTDNKSCTAKLEEVPSFKFKAETNDMIWSKNDGGVNMLLLPLNGSCVTIFTLMSSYSVDKNKR
ncbi:MAG: hypothetical protein AB7D29_01080 [Campylobacterales bacterium]